jgi:hypothetical protein
MPLEVTPMRRREAFPKLKTIETDPSFESAEIVSLWDRKKIT